MNLNKISNPANLTWEAPKSASAKWDKSIHAAAKDEDNAISIYDTIGESWDGNGVTVKRIAAALRAIGKKEDVVVNINSPGGSMFEGMAIYNTLKEHEGKVTVRVVGLAASAASIIAMAGDEIQVAKTGFLMIHNAWVVAVGNRHDLDGVSETLALFDETMAEMYSAQTGIEKKKVTKMMDEETWIKGEEAVEMGFATDLLPSDAVEADEEKPQTALNKIDAALAKAGLPRTERRALLQELKGTPSAANHVMPSANQPLENLLKDTLKLFEPTN